MMLMWSWWDANWYYDGGCSLLKNVDWFQFGCGVNQKTMYCQNQQPLLMSAKIYKYTTWKYIIIE